MPDLNASIYAIAAMCGCQWRESSLNPNIWESGIVATWDTVHYYDAQGNGVGGYGLGQWTNTQEATGVAWRLRDFYDWTIANGLDITQGNTQLQYILYEDVWFNVSHVGSNAQTLTEFLTTTSTNLDGLVEDFLANWEGVPGDALALRIGWAHQVFDYLREHKDDDPATVSWQSSSNWVLPESETLNNALCYYFYFQGFDPGGGYPGSVSGFVEWCAEKCNDPNVGYSQTYREEQTVGGITYYDCSSFIWYGLYHNDFDTEATGHSYPFNTTAMPADLAAMGWREIDRTGELKPGDIGWTSTHAEVCYTGGTGEGVFMGAHSDQLPLADQVSINNYTSQGTDFTKIFRFSSSGPGPGPSPARKKTKIWFYLKRWYIPQY